MRQLFSPTKGWFSNLNLWRLALALLLGSSVYGLYLFLQSPLQAGTLLSSRRWLVVTLLGLGGLLLQAGLLAATWTGLNNRLAGWLGSGLELLQRLRKFNLVLFGLGIALYSVVLLGPYGARFGALGVRLPLFLLLVLVGVFLLKAAMPERSWLALAGAALLFAALGYRVAVFLPDITNYPFSLGWSEASRYYYASLFFDQSVYGQDVAPTVLHPSRYLMQALPFAIPGLSLAFHRAWQVFLWLGTTFAAAYLFAWRVTRVNPKLTGAGSASAGSESTQDAPAPKVATDWLQFHMLAAWTFLFLILGPVYYHLLVPLILILWGFRSDRFWRSLGVVLLASAWAGISRVNWFPMPAMLAIAIYLMDTALQMDGRSASQPVWERLRKISRYLLPPFIWGVLGLLAAFGAQALYVLWSGNRAEQFTSSLTSDLLWYRLWPNPTFPLGILPGTLLVSLPMLWLAWSRLRAGRRGGYALIRHLGLAALLVILFAGGMVVSVKIGGGSNLHNVDAYFSLLLVVTGWIIYGRYVPEAQDGDAEPHAQAGPGSAGFGLRHAPLLALGIAIVVYFAFELGSPLVTLPQDEVERTLEIVRNESQKAAAAGGEVLLIAQRQLLTFGYLPGIPLVAEHERVFLMEMAMAGDRAYLDRFHQELKDHRYAIIISEPLFRQEKDETQIFGEENNAWVQEVSNYVLCYYQTHKLRREARIQVMIPRQEPAQGMSCP